MNQKGQHRGGPHAHHIQRSIFVQAVIHMVKFRPTLTSQTNFIWQSKALVQILLRFSRVPDVSKDTALESTSGCIIETAQIVFKKKQNITNECPNQSDSHPYQ